jgi:hypothetical protein
MTTGRINQVTMVQNVQLPSPHPPRGMRLAEPLNVHTECTEYTRRE